MTVKLRPRYLIYFILFWTIFSDALVDELNFSSSIKYLNDFCWIILFLFLIRKNVVKLFNKDKPLIIAIFIYVFICFFSSLVNGVSFFLQAWAARNTLRFMVFFVGCYIYLTESDIDVIFDKFYYIQILSFILAIYQYYMLGLHMDDLGGIFGHGNGGALNTFQAMILGYYLNDFYTKRKYPLHRIIFITGSSLFIAALAEEKAFFVYFIITVIGTVLINKPSFKSVVIALVVSCALPVAVEFLATVNESWNLDVLTNFASATNYMDKSYGLSRINPFVQIDKLFFGDSIIKRLFGIGFGGAEYCSISPLLTSDFFRSNSKLQYFDFTHQFKYIETGMLGFLSFLSIFITNTLLLMKKKMRLNSDYRINACIVFNIIAIISCWASGALIWNDAFLIYFGTVGGLIVCKEKTNNA